MDHVDIYHSPMGPLYLRGNGVALTGVSFEPYRDTAGKGAPSDCFEAAQNWLDDYFCGVFRQIDFPMNPEGTPFQKQVWRLLLDIPFGQSRTYGELSGDLAVILGKEKMSPQAVGQAVSRNPIAIIIPCHRVLGAGGALTGYASGLDRKIWLLRHEGLLR